jgi:hypothetical protein
MKQVRGRAHLTLATENTSRASTSREVIGIDSLNQQQSTVAKHLITRANCKGILVGALVGEEGWDTRPLVLINGKLCILRFSDPGASLDRNKMNYIRSLYAQLGANKEIARSAIAVGQSDGQIWTIRKFHQNTFAKLDTSAASINSIHPVNQAQKIIETISGLQSNGIVHGHICLANIGTDEETPALLDFGFGCIDSNHADLAPEIRAGLPPSMASDIYGLGKILETLLKGDTNLEIQSLIKSMVSVDPSARPRLDDVKKAFLVKQPVAKPIANAAASMKSGQVLGKITNTPPQPVEPQKEKPIKAPEIPQIKEVDVSIKSAEKTVERSEARLTTEMKITATAEEKSAVIEKAPSVAVEAPAVNKPLGPPRARQLTTLMPAAKPTPVASTNMLTATPMPHAAPAKRRARTQDVDHSEVEEMPTQADNPSATLQIVNAMGFLAWSLILISIFSAAGYFVFKAISDQTPKVDYAAYWESGQTKLQGEVIEAAVLRNSKSARNAILSQIEKKVEVPKVRNDLLKVGFSKLWAAEYTPADKKILFALSVENPNPAVLKALPAISNAHSGVILALASQLNNTKESAVSALPIEAYSKLPRPFDMAFTSLGVFGVKKVGEPSALGLARIISGNLSEASLKLFIDEDGVGKVGILKIMADELGDDYAKRVIKLNQSLGENGLPELSWFNESENVDWNSVSASTRLSLASGLSEFKDLSIEHKIDLLSSPITSLREAVSEIIIASLGDNLQPVIKTLLSADNGLRRDQMVTLVSTLSYQGENSKKFTMEWFKTSPDPQTVLNLLMARNSKELSDFFNLQAARYLANKKWEASFDTLKQLSVHYEPVARALGYARLDPKRRDHLLFLRKMSNVEPVNSIRQGIITKIKPFESKSSVSVHTIEE